MEKQLEMFIPESDIGITILNNKLGKFHNTLDLPESELKARQLKTRSQNQIILDFFKVCRHGSYTPPEILGLFPVTNRPPLTSIRRAMTDLTKLGYLEKTKEKRAGEYGELNYCWKLKDC